MATRSSGADAPRRVLVCPQEFKGSLDAAAAAEAIAASVLRVLPGAEVIVQPMADGGPGTMAILAKAAGADLIEVEVHDAYGRPVAATFALTPPDAAGQRTAVIEAAAAVALSRTAVEDRAPLRSTSRGVGELISSAADRGATAVIVGVGGTASSDGGAGAARALGLRLLDVAGDGLPDDALHLARLATIEDGVPPALRGLAVRIAVDVRNLLTGPEGAAAIFGAQKGLFDWQAPALDAAVAHWAAHVRADLGREVETVEGAGAGGGIPAGILAALPRATIESGAALVAEVVGLEAAIASADLVITGEGSLDAQTSFGKSVAQVVALASMAGVPCLAVAGVIEAIPPGMADAEPLARSAEEAAATMAAPRQHLGDGAERLLRRWLVDRPRPAA